MIELETSHGAVPRNCKCLKVKRKLERFPFYSNIGHSLAIAVTLNFTRDSDVQRMDRLHEADAAGTGPWLFLPGEEIKIISQYLKILFTLKTFFDSFANQK